MPDTAVANEAASAADPFLERVEATQRFVAATLDKQLFFIASCSKSGSTWLQHLLDGHPEICCHGEAFFPRFLRPLLEQVIKHHNASHKCKHKRNEHQRDGDLTEADLQHLYRSAVALVMGRWAAGEDVRAIGDKTPENAVGAQSLLRDLPHAKIVHLIRDGRDVCVSGWFHNLREKGEQFSNQFPSLAHYIPLMAGQKWKPYIQAARQAGAAHPDQFTEVFYEDLHTHPEETTARLLRFLGVDASDASIEACLRAGSFDRLSGGRQRGEEENGAFYRKGTVGDWRNHFDERCVEVFMQQAGDMLEQLGYAAK